MQESPPVLLIYFDFKGMAHVARHLLCYLGVSFVDVLLDRLQQQRKTLPSCVFQTLKGTKIDKSMLPALLHEGVLVEELFPIMTYICYHFAHEELLGVGLLQKARVQELMEVYSNSLPHTQSILFELADTAAVLEDQELFPTIEAYYKKTLRQSEYMKQLADFFIKEGKRKFVLGNPTIIDFYYFESSNYMLGLFGSLERTVANKNWRGRCEKQGRKVRGGGYLKIMQEYQQMMKMQPYYVKYGEYLGSFKVVGSLTSPGRKKGFARIWAIDMQQLQCPSLSN